LYQVRVWVLFSNVSILFPQYGRNKSPHWQTFLCQCKATYPAMSLGFHEALLETNNHYAIHPFIKKKGKPHITTWGWGVGSRYHIHLETGLPQRQVAGYPQPADVPGRNSSLGSTSCYTQHIVTHIATCTVTSSCYSLHPIITHITTCTVTPFSHSLTSYNYTHYHLYCQLLLLLTPTL
jgi:hypothetical protein